MKTYTVGLIFLLYTGASVAQQSRINLVRVAPGVIKMSMGIPDKFSPYQYCTEKPRTDAMNQLSNKGLPFDIKAVKIFKNSRGIQIRLPLSKFEQLYGFGMQIGSFEQRGLKKKPIVNDVPVSNIGYTHAPQPFYVSTAGYGVLVNTSRFVTFLCGSNEEKKTGQAAIDKQGETKFTTEQLYENTPQDNWDMWIDVPNAQGVELYFFEGSDIKESVQRYNLFSGGGAMPPLWGLGIKYRVKGDFTQEKVMKMATYFRSNNIPCDVIGLEPGWHTKAYSCSYLWSEKFPEPQKMINELQSKNFKLNLWEHAYVNPAAPFFNEMKPYSGNFLVWKGLVPDFINPKAASIFANYHKKELVEKGIASLKLDEADAGNIADGKSTWGFPDMTQFPSGIDGEQMRQLFGSLYAQTLFKIYKDLNQRTYFDYRASYLFTSSLPAVLYSDIYQHDDYISMISTAAFGGLLWSPELRNASSEDDMIRRLQTALLAPQAVVDSWFLEHVPWFQINREKNNAGIKMENADELESIVRKLFRQRMSLVPYLYSSFADYHLRGIPPFRPLVMDYPDDKSVRAIVNQFMIGQNLMAVPTMAGKDGRNVYFPQGTWYDFNSNKRYEGGKSYEIDIPKDKLPLFVKSGTILPLAEPNNFIDDKAVFEITCKVYGNPSMAVTLWEDDGVTYDFKEGNFNKVILKIENGKGVFNRIGKFKGQRYSIKSWSFEK